MADLLAIHLGVRPNKEKGGSAHEPSSAVETDCAASSCSEEDLAKLRAVVEQEDTSALAQSVHEKLCDFIRTKGHELSEGWNVVVRPRITVRKNGKFGRTTNYDYYAPWGQLFRSFNQVLQAIIRAEEQAAQGLEPGYAAKRGRPKKGEERPDGRRRKHADSQAASSSFAVVTGSCSFEPAPKRSKQEPSYSSSSAPSSPTAQAEDEACSD